MGICDGGNWSSYWLKVYVWLGSDFGMNVRFSCNVFMYIGLSSDVFMYIGFGSDLFMYIWLGSNFGVDVWFSSWVYLSSIVVWVDECCWGSGVCYMVCQWGSNWGSCNGCWGGSKSKTSISVSAESISAIWVSISSKVVGELRISFACGGGDGGQARDNSDKSLHVDDELLLCFRTDY